MEIRIRPHPVWYIYKEGMDESELVQRVADVVIGRDKINPPERQEHGYDWRLDAGNNWWMSKEENAPGAVGKEGDGWFLVCYRYGSVEGMKSLKHVLNWLLKGDDWWERWDERKEEGDSETLAEYADRVNEELRVQIAERTGNKKAEVTWEDIEAFAPVFVS